MDEISALILGEPVEKQESTAPRQYKYGHLVTDSLLDALKDVESSGNPLIVNKQSGAMGAWQFMPETVANLHKQGIKFNPFDEKESREAARHLIATNLEATGGDLNKALSMYGGHITKDPTSYLNKIYSRMKQPTQTAEQEYKYEPDDISSLILGEEKPSQKPEFTVEIKNSNLPVAQREALSNEIPQSFEQLKKSKVEEVKPKNAAEALELSMKKLKEKAETQKPLENLAGAFEAGLATATGVPAIAAGELGYGYGKLTGQDANKLGLAAEEALQYRPTTQKGQELTEKIGKTAEELGLNALPFMPELAALQASNAPIASKGKVATELEKDFAKRKEPTFGEEKYRVGGEIAPEKLAEQPVAEQLQKQLEERKVGQVPVAEAANEPIAPKISAVEKPVEPEIKVPEENPPMPKTKPSKAELGDAEQTLRDVGIESVRKSALERNPKEASSQFITSQADQGPYGSGMTAQINHEKTVLNNHFEKLAADSGGTVVRYGTPEEVADKMIAGKSVKSGLAEGYNNWVREGENLYKRADEVHGDKPVLIDKFADFLNKDEHFAYTEEKGLQNAIRGFMQRKKFMDGEGNVRPMTVAEAEEVRKFINNKYHHETARLGGQLKGLIDDQVFEQVGGETYQQARTHWGKGKDIYENPKAIGDLLSDKGVNQKIADETVMNKVSALPESQFNHLVETLKADNQTAAINQIKTSLVDQVRRAGESGINQPFNSIAAAKEAAKLSEKFKVAFADDPKGLEAFYKGIKAADILHIPTKYPGAAVQTHLLKTKFSDIALQRGISGTLGAAGTYLGGPTLGGMGVAAGEIAGSKMSQARISKRQQKQLKKELTNLRDIGK
ncbi:hypothetical protein [Caudoviricetes sp.]|nr:hypothetical protein [Caudoviricetes sp.]